MAVSLATRLTPYMGSGDVPRVVISGRFVLGLYLKSSTGQPRYSWQSSTQGSSYALYLQPHLDLRGLARAYGSGRFDMLVRGRLGGLSDYNASGLSDTGGGLQDVRSSENAADVDQGDTVYNPDGTHESDYPCAVRMWTTEQRYVNPARPGLGYKFSWFRKDESDAPAGTDNRINWMYETMRQAYPAVGETEVGTSRIILAGRLGGLDLTAIRPAAVFPLKYYRDLQNTVHWCDRVFMSVSRDTYDPWPSYTGGWFLDRVDVYDQQQLRGQIQGGGGKIVWH